MKKLFTSMMLLCAISASADNGTPITVASGFNADVIMMTDADAPKGQGALDGHGSALVTSGVTGVSASDVVLPLDGKLTVSNGHVYQLAKYVGNNALYIGISSANSASLGTPESGTLIFSNATACDTLGMLIVGANRENLDLKFKLVVNYSDGSRADLGSFKVSDWGQDNEHDAVYTCNKRYRFDAGSNPESGTFRLSEVRAVVDAAKTISSVTITTECQNDQWGYGCLTFLGFTAIKATSTGINNVTTAKGEATAYTIGGVRLGKMQKGLNIVREANGQIRKVIVK
ncbi:MAG: hypothetical protein SPL67_07925 [Prevotella sp.]|nr:hypothetical protein [Prevotella sp.]